MTWLERVEQVGIGTATAVIFAFGTGLLWVLRIIFTNQTKINMLEADIKAKTEMLQVGLNRSHDDIADVKASVTRIEDVLLRKGNE